MKVGFTSVHETHSRCALTGSLCAIEEVSASLALGKQTKNTSDTNQPQLLRFIVKFQVHQVVVAISLYKVFVQRQYHIVRQLGPHNFSTSWFNVNIAN